MKKYLATVLIGLAAGIGGSAIFQLVSPGREQVIVREAYVPIDKPREAVLARNYSNPSPINEDFSNASELSTRSVVYVKTTSPAQYNQYNWFDFYFHGRSGQSISNGSGVIFREDGYIITNNHVIENASKIEIIHEKQSFEAAVIGTDPSTDLAVLKVDASNLPAIRLGSSKALRIGEWVLAVGNPFNLNSTVTAGIVSAKARSLNVVNSQFPIESFIQTDAAINPGNSGGALVNLKGELVGINTAILSKTGSYTGYGFAVPADIVVKVVNDIIHFGEVQKAFIGASVTEINTDVASRFKLKDFNGVVLNQIAKEGAAEKAGLKTGDVILKINNLPVDSKSHFDEAISYQSPGDKVKILYTREGQVNEVYVTLTNREGTTEFLKRDIYMSPTLGAELEKLSKVEKNKLGVDYGVRILKVKGGLFRKLGIDEGFIITAINGKKIQDAREIVHIIENTRGRVVIEGINPNGTKGYYSYYY